MFNPFKTRISDVVIRIAEEFKLVAGKLLALSEKIEDYRNNINKDINTTMINGTSNLFSTSVQDCYINRDYHVDCVSVDKTTDHIKFIFQGGVWRGYFDLQLDNLFPYPNYPIKPNTTYILSFELFATPEHNSRIEIQQVFLNLYGRKMGGEMTTSQTADGWSRFEMKIQTTDEQVKQGTFGFFITKADFSGIPEGGELHLRKLQLQEGGISTFFNKNFNRDKSEQVDALIRNNSQKVYTYTKSINYNNSNTITVYSATSTTSSNPNSNSWSVKKIEWDLKTGKQIGEIKTSVQSDINIQTLDETMGLIQWR